MKVKVTLRFRGREMAHQEFGFGQVQKFIKDLTPYGHPDAPPKLIGKGLNVMISPLRRNKRAPNPNQGPKATEMEESSNGEPESEPAQPEPAPRTNKPERQRVATNAAENGSFGQ